MSLRALLLLLFCSALSVCRAWGQPETPGSEPVLARAGGLFVSEREFLERFELTPGLYRHRKSALEQEKLEFLLSMIAEKLLVQDALDRGLDREEITLRGVLEVTRMFARDELYRREVREKVSVSTQELNEGIRRARRVRLVRYLFFESEEEAKVVYSGLRTADDLRRLSIDSSMQVLRDTASVLWGDAEPAIENAAFTLRRGEISPVVQAGDGWYILGFVSDRPNPGVQELTASALRSRVESVIRSRKEGEKMQEFLAELMDRAGVYSPGEPFSSLASAVGEVLAESEEALTPSAAAQVKGRLRGRLGDTVLVAGSRAWTAEEAVDLLASRGFVVRGEPRRRAGRRLYEAFREWSAKEVTEEEAVRRGLDRLPEVQRAVEPWRDALLAGRMKAVLGEHVTVTDAEVAAYSATLDPAWGVPVVRLRELRTATMERMREAFSALERGSTFESTVRRYSDDPRARANGGLTGPFPITERKPVGEIAWRLAVGERYGPIRDSAGVLIFEVVEKQNVPPHGDTARVTAAAAELLRMKQRRLVTMFLSQSANRRGFDLYQDRLARLSVSPVPMLAFRFLGFGGRMFAVPFVDPQLDWLNVEPPEEILLP
jgi:hypothetical protein